MREIPRTQQEGQRQGRERLTGGRKVEIVRRPGTVEV